MWDYLAPRGHHANGRLVKPFNKRWFLACQKVSYLTHFTIFTNAANFELSVLKSAARSQRLFNLPQTCPS